MEFTPWVALTDATLIGVLLLIGAVLRAWIRPIQTLMIPASVLGGILGLIFGPMVLGWLPFSDQLSTYSSVLIAGVFACVAMTDDFNIFKLNRTVGGFAAQGVMIYALQVSLGMLLVLVLLQPLFGTGDEVGVVLFAGWAGGYGTAAAMGDAFAESDPELSTLAFTSATVGLVVGIVGGLIQARIGAMRGQVEAFASMSALPEEERTGLIRQVNKRPSIGQHTFSGSSVETLAIQISLVVATAGAGYGITEWIQGRLPELSVPVFVVAFLIGLVARAVMSRLNVAKYVDPGSLNSTSGAFTDVLIVCGIASIDPSVAAGNWLELSILFVFGLVLCLFLGQVIAPRIIQHGWFERQLFTWGWSTGGVSTGIAMLRVVDPKLKSGTLEDFGLAYLPVTPVEITAVTFVPGLVLAGLAWTVVGIWGAIAVVTIVAAFILARMNARDGQTLTTSSASTGSSR
ncbi:sodium/glutamate symporter [Auritidibacter ignavus]|uniref:sodium/glutamate symporter n=1 Tax=Auritidibacter ignavus TaxID=678932 RepID=UPI0024B8CFB2|nr:sodium:glutamate symporter [Auritidibacter ignavus]WHS34171.1 sodium:glutamate symporter [Auritidibacter ignavus]